MLLYKHITKKLHWLPILLLAALALMVPRVVLADDYHVTAVVPYPAPTQAAVVDQPLNGATVADAAQTITGSCELLNPEGYVAIWRNGVSIGSSVCDGGFSVPIMLQVGQNVLTVRSASASGLYGPDSAPLSITLLLPANVPPAVPPTGTIPSNPHTVTIDANAGAVSGLTATTSTSFGVLNTDNEMTMSVILGGGQPAYDLSINWGDGSVEAHTVQSAGTYNYTHIYAESKAYIVHGQAQDVTGAIVQFSYAVISPKKPSKGGIFAPILQQPPIDYVPEAMVLGAVVLLACDYWLGWHVAETHYKKLLAAQQKKKQARHRAKKRPKKKGVR